MNVQKAEFLLSAASAEQFPKTRLPEIAFLGKSNVGKSSAINCLLRRKQIAKVGGKPGKTVHVNYFLVDGCYFVDLPGYGYAQVPQSEKERWAKLMEQYFAAGRVDFAVLLVDARHAPTQNDITMVNWLKDAGCPYAVAANKIDRCKKSEIPGNLRTIREDLALPDSCALIPFSGEKGTGRDELMRSILAAIAP